MIEPEPSFKDFFYNLMDSRQFAKAYDFLLQHPGVLDEMTVSQLRDYCLHFKPTSSLDPYHQNRVQDENLDGLRKLLLERVFEESENLVHSS